MAHLHKNPRYFYDRVRAEGHNVPVFNPDKGPNQNPRTVAKFVQFASTPQQAVAIVDLKPNAPCRRPHYRINKRFLNSSGVRVLVRK